MPEDHDGKNIGKTNNNNNDLQSQLSQGNFSPDFFDHLLEIPDFLSGDPSAQSFAPDTTFIAPPSVGDTTTTLPMTENDLPSSTTTTTTSTSALKGIDKLPQMLRQPLQNALLSEKEKEDVISLWRIYANNLTTIPLDSAITLKETAENFLAKALQFFPVSMLSIEQSMQIAQQNILLAQQKNAILNQKKEMEILNSTVKGLMQCMTNFASQEQARGYRPARRQPHSSSSSQPVSRNGPSRLHQQQRAQHQGCNDFQHMNSSPLGQHSLTVWNEPNNTNQHGSNNPEPKTS